MSCFGTSDVPKQDIDTSATWVFALHYHPGSDANCVIPTLGMSQNRTYAQLAHSLRSLANPSSEPLAALANPRWIEHVVLSGAHLRYPSQRRFMTMATAIGNQPIRRARPTTQISDLVQAQGRAASAGAAVTLAGNGTSARGLAIATGVPG